jgi:hypothetical protein
MTSIRNYSTKHLSGIRKIEADRQGPVLIEIGVRAIGSVCGRAHTYRLGFDYQELALRASLGD